MSFIKAAKTSLRKEIEKKLSRISMEERNRQSKEVREKLFKLPEFADSKRVSIYLSTDNEISTQLIVRKILEAGKKCFIPRFKENGYMEMVELYSMEDWSSLPINKWKIRQPSFKDERENALSAGLDLMIVPGVAFTTDGCRLGHGGGYYDRYLETYFQLHRKPLTLVGVTFKEQIVDKLPTEETDYKVNMLLYAQ